MINRTLSLVAILSLALVGLARWSHADETPATAPAPEIKNAIAVVHGFGDNKVAGVVKFTLTEKGLLVIGEFTGLTPGDHGFHIHEYGDVSADDGKNAGGHFNPGHEHHGGPEGEHHHAGDLGNVTADADGKAHIELIIPNLTLVGGPEAIVGRSVIIHAKPDDLKSDPSGNSGARIGGGVIGIAKAE